MEEENIKVYVERLLKSNGFHCESMSDEWHEEMHKWLTDCQEDPTKVPKAKYHPANHAWVITRLLEYILREETTECFQSVFYDKYLADWIRDYPKEVLIDFWAVFNGSEPRSDLKYQYGDE